MARIRTIKPEFWTDEKLVQLPFHARLVFIGLWNFADDDGRLKDEPTRLKMQIMPGDLIDMAATLDLLAAAGLVERWDHGDQSILVLPGFDRHQVISHRSKSRLTIEGYKKAAIPAAARRQLAIKYGCQPGNEHHPAQCYFCQSAGSIYWPKLYSGQPGPWVAFSGLEIGNFIPESSGGPTEEKNFVLSCRYCRGAINPPAFTLEKFKSLQNTPSGREGKGREGNGREGKCRT